MSEPLRDLLLQAPPEDIDDSLKPLVEACDPEPTSLQLLHVIDVAVHSASASTFAVAALQGFYEAKLRREGRTHEENVAPATWRNPS